MTRRLTEVLTEDRLAAAVTALLLAFSASFWSQATTARVYALSALLLALTLFELARLERGRGGSPTRAWFWFGLGLANHLVIVILFPLLVRASLRATENWRRAALPAFAVLPGLLLYAYVPLVAASDPVQNWGDPSSPARLVAYLTREDFWNKRFVEQPGDVWRVATHYLREIPHELTWLGTALLAFGVAARGRPARYGRARPVPVRRERGADGRAREPAGHLSLGPLFDQRLARSGPDRRSWSRARFSAGFPIRCCALSSPRSVPMLALATGWQRADRSSDAWARDYAERLLKGLEPGALLFAEEDNVLFPLSYLHHVEGLRPDVELVLQGINRLDAMRIRPDRRPIYLTHPRELGSPALATHPDGLAFRLLPAELAFEGRPWTQVALASFEAIREPGSLRYLDRSLVGNYYFAKALNLETSDPRAALEAVRRLEVISFDNDVNLVNAGLLHERSGRFDEARADFARAAAIEPKNELAVTRARFWREKLNAAARPSAPEPHAGARD